MNWPEIFLKRMQAQLGSEYPDFLAALATPAPVSLRLNAGKVAGELPLPPIPWTRTGYYLPERPLFTLDPWWHAGGYYVQEASSMLLEQALRQHLPVDEGLLVLDLCGAPGGKSTHLASLLPPGSLLISNEMIRSRAHVLAENLQKWGMSRVAVTQNQPQDFQALQGRVDALLVDAPCSGEGLFRRDPAAAGEWSPAAQEACVARQRDILTEVWPALRPGGLLVYSTCTFFPGENEENLAWLAEQEAVESLPLDLPEEWGFQAVEHDGICGYYSLPHRVQGEGFFLAVLRKKGEERIPRFKRSKQPDWEPATKAQKALTEAWCDLPEGWHLQMRGDQLRAVPPAWEEIYELLDRRLKVLYLGLAVGEVKKKNLKPDPALALAAKGLRSDFPRMDLDHQPSLQYLSRENLSAPPGQGWQVLAYQGLNLGFGKQVQGRVNNYYPDYWRIRMNWQEREAAIWSLAGYPVSL